ncbi:MAG: hypothetical protein IT373_03970 [Polyangiaceae bacterium]|nr:hypothetical protein [Polyangiaceae bacterium]
MASRPSLGALVAWGERRLTRSVGGRVGLVAGCLAAALCVGAGAWIAREGPAVPLSGWVVRAVRWLGWSSLAPLGLAAAWDPGAAERRDGLDWMARSRGIDGRRLALAHALAVVRVAVRRLGAGVLVCAGGLALVARADAAAILALVPGLVVFAVVCGVTLGLAASACGRAAGRYGPWLLAAVVLLPWMLSDLWAVPRASLPGLLGACLDALVRVTGAA